MISNLQTNFNSRINQIWGSYIVEQKNQNKLNINLDKMNNDVETIKKTQSAFLKINTQIFLDQLQS